MDEPPLFGRCPWLSVLALAAQADPEFDQRETHAAGTPLSVSPGGNDFAVAVLARP